MPAESLAWLGPRVRRQAFRKGAFVWLEGDPGDIVQVLVEGRIKTSRVSATGEELVLQYETSGDVLGLPAALIDGATRMTQGEALEDVVLIALDRDVFVELLERQPLVMRRVLDIVARTARGVLETLSGVGFLDVRSRVAQKLLDLAELYGEPAPDGTRIAMRLSQRAIAGMVAASREKVNRALARLTADGAIRHERGSITILDADRLRKQG